MEKEVSLPDAYAPITPHAFYPDRVTINFQYAPRFSHTELTKGLRANGFVRRQGFWAYRINIDGPRGYRRAGFPLRITRPRFAAPINCYLDLNPLRLLHDQRPDYAGELSSIGRRSDGLGNNWLHPDLVGPDCRPVWDLCQHYLNTARQVISDIIADIQTQSGAGHLASPECIHTSAHTVECAIDFGTNNPRQLVVDFKPAFAALLRDNEHREYAAGMVVRPEADLMIHGFVNSATRVKMYCRTNRRTRFETLFRPDTFDRFNVARTINSDGPDFRELFGQCAHQAQQFFIALRARTARSLNINAIYSPIDLIIALAASNRRPNVMHEVLDCLLRTGKVENTLYNRHLVNALKKAGILEPSLAHGFSCFASRYGYAAALLANAQDDYFTDKLRKLGIDLSTMKRQARKAPRRAGLLQ